LEFRFLHRDIRAISLVNEEHRRITAKAQLVDSQNNRTSWNSTSSKGDLDFLILITATARNTLRATTARILHPNAITTNEDDASLSRSSRVRWLSWINAAARC